MERRIIAQLVAWKNKKNRMPLVLNGARQVGKTHIIQQFGKSHFKNMVYLNLELASNYNAYLQETIEPKALISYLEILSKENILPHETLIVFDEIQASEKALLSLKYFSEQTPEYAVVAAGSLLGIAINREKYSFPVGKVDELEMHPMSFEEFLWAKGNEKLCQKIQEHFIQQQKLPKALHSLALGLLAEYFIVGGMPAAVKNFIENNSYLQVKNIQQNIINDYLADMAKYASNATAVKIRACYNSIPAQLAKENKKFQYKIVQRGGTTTIFGEAIEWLGFAGIALKAKKINAGLIPISAYVDVAEFKLYLNDVGLLAAITDMPTQSLLAFDTLPNDYTGLIIENYVAQALVCNKWPLLYWKNDNTAEVDFVIQQEENVTPIEVKKGYRTKSTSFTMFKKKYNCSCGIKISSKNFGEENEIKAIPLYAVWCLNRI